MPQPIVTESPVAVLVLDHMKQAEAEALLDKLNRTRTVQMRPGHFVVEPSTQPGGFSLHVKASTTETAYLLKGYAWALWESTLEGRDW